MAPSLITPPSSPPFEDPYDRKTLPNGKARRGHAERVVRSVIHNRIQNIDSDTCMPGDDEPFFVADLGEVYRLHAEWKRRLGRVTPFFAIKCNPDPKLLRLLNALGTGFDCASVGEIKQVLNMGVDPSRIIFANPCKILSGIRYAREQAVSQMTFDTPDELYKIAKVFPEADLYLRISARDPTALTDLSLKFGAPMSRTEELLQLARNLGLNVVGVSFHVGSGGKGPGAFRQAIRDARTAFDQGARLGYRMHTLDIGGGFSAGPLFAETADIINAALDEYFSSDIRVIAEPGRYMVNSAFTAAAAVIARRTSEEKSTMLYINDSVYGSYMNCIMEKSPDAFVFRRAGHSIFNDAAGVQSAPLQEYSIWGCTCDSMDCVNPSCKLPGDINVGDWLFYPNMGAYSNCTSTSFNGFPQVHDIMWICTEPDAKLLVDDER
ncbi:ornithine decarboxylase [Saccharata proteae CBS 121410]|uniref:ornithine decarboxylase n=1 Tax=Saccharata proteae CBS 121410 TaxID=1314787 RepID=A0A9P4HYP8_9PEZI|nr:ornithine decarboxylase [Saccharata proteae CBS 121410]